MTRIFVFIFSLFLGNSFQVGRIDNICKSRYISKIYLELGESGILTAYNTTISHGNLHGNESVKENCQFEIVTCPSCSVSITFKHMNLSCFCGAVSNLFFHNPCRCDYVWITEPPYDDPFGTSICRKISSRSSGGLSNTPTYKSKTRAVKISFFYDQFHSHAFTLDYASETNRQIFFGTSQPSEPPYPTLSSGFISSPFFPVTYPRDLVSEYVMTCINKSNYVYSTNIRYSKIPDVSCRIYLSFSDFLLESASFLEFYDGNGRIDVVSGSSFRPPVFITSTNSLTIRFHANGQTSLGFKASYWFIAEEDTKRIVKPVTDCGGFVENLGGTITMMNMVRTGMMLYDCIWLIKPSESFFEFKSHLYLKITKFVNFGLKMSIFLRSQKHMIKAKWTLTRMGCWFQRLRKWSNQIGNTELQVRKGLTSESPLLETLRHPALQRFREFIYPVKQGYYVRLRALFGPATNVAITYASLSYNNCFFLSEFLCRNDRCISKKLKCDGFDHCGDNSDESEICFKEWRLEPSFERWYPQTPNYYFPKIKEYTGLKMMALIILICLGGLIFLMLILMISFYRMGKRSRRQGNLQVHLEPISELLDGFSDEISMEDVVIDDPPCYEHPPNYEDVVKSCMTRNIDLGVSN